MAKKIRKNPPKPDPERVDTAVALILRGCAKHEIKAQLKERFGVASQTTERDISHARARIRELADLPDDDLRAVVLTGLFDCTRDADADVGDRVRAWQAIAKLMGLNKASPAEKEIAEKLGILDYLGRPEVQARARMIIDAEFSDDTESDS